MKNKIIVWILFCIYILGVSYFQLKAKKTEDTHVTKNKCKNRIIGAPIVFYSPETSLGFGAAGTYVFRMIGCEDKITRPSSFAPVFLYTLKKQFKAQLGTELFFKNNDYRLNGFVSLDKFPLKFYGIGSETLEENEEDYTPKSINFFLSLLRKIGKGFNIGLQYHLKNWDILEIEENKQLATGNILGVDGGTASGVSIVLNRDTRDFLFFPMTGDLMELNFRVYPKFLGSSFEYNTLTLDLRKYFTVFSTHVLAVQYLLKHQSGDVPFLELTKLGGEYIMRGYLMGRYRDKNLMMMQAEYRFPISGRFGAVGFAGLGNVAAKMSQIDVDLKYSYGFGLRYTFDKKEKIRLRMDIAFGKGTSGFYFSALESF
jgi:outer membrane protein assembly factor BamA